MRKLFLFFILLLLAFTSSCSTIKERNKKREIQSKIIRALNSKIKGYSKCAKSNDIYTSLGKDRIRVELQLLINHKGQVEKFQVDDKKYPDQFVECLFKIVDLIIFPALDKDTEANINQPMIFTK